MKPRTVDTDRYTCVCVKIKKKWGLIIVNIVSGYCYNVII